MIFLLTNGDPWDNEWSSDDILTIIKPKVEGVCDDLIQSDGLRNITPTSAMVSVMIGVLVNTLPNFRIVKTPGVPVVARVNCASPHTILSPPRLILWPVDPATTTVNMGSSWRQMIQMMRQRHPTQNSLMMISSHKGIFLDLPIKKIKKRFAWSKYEGR